MTKEKREEVHTGLAVFLIMAGIGFGIAGFLVDPIGEISGSVLGLIGELLTLAGALLGIVQYTSSKIDSFRNELGLKQEE